MVILQEEEDIYIAIPPPLVPPLTRQLASSHDSGSTHLPTPTSTSSSSYAHWTLDTQFQRPASILPFSGASGHGIPHEQPTHSRPPLAHSIPPVPPALQSSTAPAPVSSVSTTAMIHPNNTPSLTTPVSSPPVAPLPTQVTSRLYSFSAAVHPTSGEISHSSSSSTPPAPLPQRSSHFEGSSSSRGLLPSHAVMSGSSNIISSPSGPSFMQYPSLRQSPVAAGAMAAGRRGSSSSMTESTRAAATAAIVNTLNSRGDARPPRGDNPYIPSSLSMLFSDPEVMLAQEEEEVERAQLQQQQQQLRQRYMDSTRSFSGDHRVDLGHHDLGNEGDDYNNDDQEEDDDHNGDVDSNDAGNGHARGADGRRGEEQRLLRPDQRDLLYGFEVVQDERQDGVYHPYATMMS
ncbi:hypothetical protein BGZ98_007719, partial [Dissophora globulifera]